MECVDMFYWDFNLCLTQNINIGYYFKIIELELLKLVFVEKSLDKFFLH